MTTPVSTPADLAPRDRMWVDRDMAEPEVVPFASGLVVVQSLRAPHRDGEANQDAAAVLPMDGQRGVLAVADGVGGMPDGDQAARIALEQMLAAVDEASREGLELRDAVLNGFERANAAVRKVGTGAATTLAAVELQDGSVRPYHAGDSLILVVGQRGKIKFQSVSHSPVGYAVEAGVLTEQEAMHHEDRHLVSNIVGIADMRIEIGPVLPLDARDTLLLATDGLSDNLGIDEIVARIRRGPLQRAAAELMAEVRRRMQEQREGRPSKPDDATFLLYRRER